ncbi:MAG: energy-coupling factor ABC transporter ATP-binding protein [Sphingomonadaceae bacterium]
MDSEVAVGKAEIVLRLEGVSYSYLGRYPAVDSVDLSVALGERVVILGANGCGKSTLLKIMDGLLHPSSGRIEAFGEDITRVADDIGASRRLHRRVGLVFQDSDVQLFSPTVWDDVAFGPLQLGWDPAEVNRRVEEALELMEIADLAQRAPYELSEGEKKRAAIATVLAVDPELLLLDEPTASLDPRSKAVLIDLILRLGGEGRTVVTTTQELEVAREVGVRAVVFGDRERRPIADGPVQTILADTDLLVRANLIHPRLPWRR